MEREVCHHDKFGYCRYKKECKKIHFTEECKQSEDCENSKTCPKRHPKKCKRYAVGNCRFLSDCAYEHKKPTTNKEHEDLKVKVETMEKVLHAMTRKVLSLENEVIDLKRNKINHLVFEDLKNKVSELDKEKNIQKDKVDESLNFNHNSIKETSSTPKDKLLEELKSKSELLKCEKCNYSCKKEKSLKNHMLTKHDYHECKECQKKLPNFMQLLKHKAEHHTEEQKEISEEERLLQKQIENEHGEDHEAEKEASHVFDESMLEEFLDKK